MTPARTASPRTARAINDRIVLELLVEQGPLTAAALRELTGLSRPSVADILGRLGRDGLVAVVGESGEARRGPNARLYGLVGSRAHVAALDVRTHGVAFTLADLAGQTLAETVLPVPSAGPGDDPAIVTAVLDALTGAMRRAGITDLHTAVMGAPGLADPATGALRPNRALPRWHRRLHAALREAEVGAVVLENEVNLAGIAEHRLGAVPDRDTYLLLWLGQGIGAAVVLDGRLRRGASGGAGELGFLPVPGTGGLPSALDSDRGFFALASGPAVGELAAGHGLPVPPADPAAGGTGAPPAAAVVRAAAEAADGPSAAFLDALAARIAVAVASVAAVLDPGCVVLGGEVGLAGGTALAERVGRALGPLSPLDTEVRPSAVTGNPVLGGALLTALDAARGELFGRGD